MGVELSAPQGCRHGDGEQRWLTAGITCAACGESRPLPPPGDETWALAPEGAPVFTTPLTRAQVAALPAWTAIRVLWCGGNGPHDYVVRRDEHGWAYAGMPNCAGRDAWRNRPLEFVGDAKPFTIVWRRKP